MIIVTGGAGFIGSAVVWGLNLRGIDDVMIVDRLETSESWKNLRGLRFAQLVHADDFRKEVANEGISRGTHAVVHMGACTDTTESDADFLVDNNFAYSRELAEAAIRSGVRFVYASSAATYGDGHLGYSDNPDELGGLRPLNIYGYSKHLFDLWLRRERLLDRVAGLKFSNVFGPNEYHKGAMRSMALQAFLQIQKTGGVKLFKSYREKYADGEQMRDFVYVKDAVSMVLFMLDHPQATGIFNAGSGTARTWNDLAEAVFRALGRDPRIEYVDMPPELRGQYQYFTCLEMDRLQRAGYARPMTALEDAVNDYVRNYLARQDHLDTAEPGTIPVEPDATYF